MTLKAIVCCSAWSSLTLLVASCASLIGADEELTDAAHRLCVCVQDDAALSQVLGSTASCTDELSRRLSDAREGVRAQWLEFYASTCSGACSNGAWRDCFYQPPTCSQGGCSSAEECCDFRQGGSCDGAICAGVPS